MGVTVQVRDLDPAVDSRLKSAAAAKGLSYSEFLRRELTRIAERLRIEERWAEVVSADAVTTVAEREASRESFEALGVSTDEIVQIIREVRDGREER